MALLAPNGPEGLERPTLDWGLATRALGGEQESGDLHVVVHLPIGALFAVVDGLGHGPEAARASRQAAAAIESNATEAPDEILRRCHEELKETRGAVATVARVSERDETVSWLGVGNVEGVLFPANATERAQEYAPVRGGIIGSQLPQLRPSAVSLHPGDVIVLASDGVRPGFGRPARMQHAAQAIAEQILREHGNPEDDALVLVARYLGNRL